jgi:hypothetical protein
MQALLATEGYWYNAANITILVNHNRLSTSSRECAASGRLVICLLEIRYNDGIR